jgi:hypothetical protein
MERTSSSAEAPTTRSYRGRVVSGRGIASRVLGDLEPQIQQEIGAKIVNGSLNVILNRPVRLRDSSALLIEDGRRRFWPASVAGTPVWVYRWVGATEHVIELVAEHHLRSTLGLQDGDTIRVILRSKDVEPTSLARLLAWAILWMGRRNWYYTRSRYVRRVGVAVRRAAAIRNGFRHVGQRGIGVGRRFVGSILRRPEAPQTGAQQPGGDVADGSADPVG